MNRFTACRRQAGQTATEYLGVLVVVAALVGAVATSDVGSDIAGRASAAICRIAGGSCDTGGNHGGRSSRRATLRASSAHAAAKVPPGTGTPGDPGDVQVPGMGKPPPPGPGDGGAGPYKSKKPSLKDRLLREKYKAVASAADTLGLDHAADNMRYYLGKSGKRKSVDPEAIMRDIDPMRDGVRALAQQYGTNAYKRAMANWDGTSSVEVPFWSPWTLQDYYEGFPKDWFYAMGAFSYAVSGVVRVDPPATAGGKPRVSIQYKTHVFDRYNWDSGKSTGIGPFTIKDTELQKLHRTGLAREYEIAGSSGVTSGAFDPSKASGGVPQPDTGRPDREGRDGSRPGRR